MQPTHCWLGPNGQCALSPEAQAYFEKKDCKVLLQPTRCDPGVQQVTCQEDRAFSRDLLKKAAGLAILSRVAHPCDSPLAPDLAVRASVSSWIEATASVAG
jgi:hypothetical protein